MEPVRSSRNPRVAAAIRLHRARRRIETGRTLLEGPHLLEEAVRAGAAIHTVFVSDDDDAVGELTAGLDAQVLRVTRTVMNRLAGTQHPRGPVAVMTIPASEEAGEHSLVVAWGVRDPGNLGTLNRSAAAFELACLVGPSSADPWSPKVLRAAAGAHFRTRIERTGALSVDGLRERGLTVVAAIVQGGDSPTRLAEVGQAALLVGGEGSGLPTEVVSEADLLVTIPMPGHIESLNAAVAGSLLAYELARHSR